MAREEIFPVVSVPFAYSADFGAYVFGMTAVFELTVGETYVISWDGEEYTRTAFAADAYAPGAVGIGNPAFIGGENDPEGLTFLIGYIPSTNEIAMITTTSESSHDIGIYKEVDCTIIFQEQDVTFVPDEDYFSAQLGNFLLEEGETYNVVFDGVEKEYTAFVTDDLPYVLLGDFNMRDPYLMLSVSAATGAVEADTTMISTSREGGTHTVGIYSTSKTNTDDSEDDENEVVYSVKEKTLISLADEIRKKTGATGSLVFPDGMIDAIPDGVQLNIEPDFTNGDMVIVPGVGKSFINVTVCRPEELVPENIAKDVNVAGIIGTHEGGGGEYDWSDTNLGYYSYKITESGQTIQLRSILYDNIYEDKGSYDVNIPDQIAGFNTEIYCG